MKQMCSVPYVLWHSQNTIYKKTRKGDDSDTMKGDPPGGILLPHTLHAVFFFKSTRSDNRHWELYTMKDLSVYILWDDLGENVWLHSSAKITNILYLTIWILRCIL